MTCKTCGDDVKDRVFCVTCLAGPNPYAGMAGQPVRLIGLSPQYDMRRIFATGPTSLDLPTKSELREAGVIDLAHKGWRFGRIGEV